jgi:hypothetical protein
MIKELNPDTAIEEFVKLHCEKCPAHFTHPCGYFPIRFIRLGHTAVKTL